MFKNFNNFHSASQFKIFDTFMLTSSTAYKFKILYTPKGSTGFLIPASTWPTYQRHNRFLKSKKVLKIETLSSCIDFQYLPLRPATTSRFVIPSNWPTDSRFLTTSTQPKMFLIPSSTQPKIFQYLPTQSEVSDTQNHIHSANQNSKLKSWRTCLEGTP
jgi:hypothetical protein